ncbi:hypothetical protein L3X38_032175 [Prunus dulcis]|uniref:hAT-like transposase RNase-H fold domain-containing protein n=1 Tax=Prunus dulcis TaxID=3755 RepID=A0AAD4VDW8_PRUDU|nr:hypothetical protein L3X38_032175 [Prunus dulcis]
MEGSPQTPTINTSLTNLNESPSPIPTTTPTEPLVQRGTSTLPPIPKKRVPIRKASEVWKHFTKDTVEPGSDIRPRVFSIITINLMHVIRWNSTYDMLEAALKLQKGFERLEEEDSNFASYFEEILGHFFVKLLKRFYEATLKLSTYKTVTSHVAFHEMCSIVDLLKKMMTMAMVLDPRYKVDYVHFTFGDLEKDASKVNVMISGVKDLIMKLYEVYKKEDLAAAQAYVEANFEGAEETNIVDSDERLERFMRSRKEKHVVQIGNEVHKYLLELPENPKKYWV